MNLNFIFYDTDKTNLDYDNWNYSFFLAGPTDRTKFELTHWRKEAVKIFKDTLNSIKKNITVSIISPEFSLNENKMTYQEIVDWELFHLNRSTKIFWIPRTEDLPGFTTNVEFGMFHKDENTFYGRPDNAFKVRYLDYIWKKNRKDSREIKNNLKDLIDYAINCTIRSK